MCPSQKDSQWDSSDREQPNRPNSVLRTGTSLKVTKAKTSYTTVKLYNLYHINCQSGRQLIAVLGKKFTTDGPKLMV